MISRKIVLLFVAAIGFQTEAFCQTGYTEVFPLAIKLHYSYLFESRTTSYNVTVLEYQSIDSGRVDYVVQDSTRLGDSVVVWTVKQTEYHWHFRFPTQGGISYWTSRDTTVLLTERLFGKHALVCSSWVWNFPVVYPTPIVYPYPTDSVYRYADSSPFTIVRRYLPLGPPSSSAFDSLYFGSSIGFGSRTKLTEGHAISHFYTSLKVCQLEMPTHVSVNSGNVVTHSLSQNFPNPFNASTTISYSLATSSFVELRVFDILGREVMHIDIGAQDSGVHSLVLDARNLASGIYLYQLHPNTLTMTGKFILSK
jgi:hypothetical protein